MDLVKAYDSEMDEDSDIEEITTSVPKNVDVINLDSDSEEERAIEKEKVAENKEQLVGAITPQIDCIDLDLSDSTEKDSPVKNTYIDLDISDSTEKNSPIKKTNLNVSGSTEKNSPSKEACIDLDMTDLTDSSVKKTSEVTSSLSTNSNKKIDYLNLESSESDNECENNENNISNLMDTASVLNETPCGPIKPTDVSVITHKLTESMLLRKPVDKTVTSNSNSSRNTPDLIQNSIPHNSTENSVLDDCDKDSTNAFPLENNNASDNLSCIFREDNRVIEASKKINLCRIPHQVIQTHNAHTNLITSLNWCIPKFSYLFLSASQDGSIKIWDLYRTNSVQCIKANSGLNAAKWSLDGGQIVAGGFNKKAFVFDVQTGKRIVQYDIYNIVTCMECHPYMEDVFLVGTRNAILGFDIRVDTTFPIRTFLSQCEEVLDTAFLDENEFVCSTNIVSHDSADRTIMAWDFASGAKLSNQIYLERYTCPSLKVHPSDSTFIAQTNGNYIAAFSTTRPYKMKDKSFRGHKVSGYGIECDISPDGKYTVSGDVDGSLYFYNYSTASTVLVTPKRKVPTNRVKWHPVLSSTLISSSYDGQIHVWK